MWDSENEPFPGEVYVLKNILVYHRNKPDGKCWSHNQLKGHNLFVSGIAQKPKSQHIAVSFSYDVRITGSGESLSEVIPNPKSSGPLRWCHQ